MVNTNSFYYDAAIAVALTSTLALVVALIVAVIVGRDGPSVSVGAVIFALTGPILLWRLWRSRLS
jgi:H+/Cl- antiporter ClcA